MTETTNDLDTLSLRLNLPVAEIILRADQHTLEVQTWLASRSPDGARWIGRGVRASSTGIQVPLLNLALGSDFHPDVDDAAIHDEIEAVKAFFAGRQVPWYWWLGATTQPSNIADYLQQHGMAFDRPSLPAMVAQLPALTLSPENSSITVWQASALGDLIAASMIRRIAFRFPEGAALNYFNDMAESWLTGDVARLYLARWQDDPPAAIGALIMGDGSPGVYVMATLPKWRRHGLGKAILARILADASAMPDRYSMIVLTASRFGFPLYQQMGFVPVFDYAIYHLIEQ
ncbi:MAG TPA: GNAT family N-acetyltransferase [Phototrophicaceae bacterium]|jgi:GNAT superfamily N-acetyltransferase|nr:GNAT family N-acetyltransferase [Phototrophicaceae bacterium]